MDLVSILPHLITVSVMLVVFGLGLDASRQDALSLFRNPGLLLRSWLSMNVIMPLVAAGFVVAFDLPTPVDIALVALAISPVPPLLPRKEMKAGGQESYAIGLCVAIALLSIITVPIAVALFTGAFGRAGEISPLQVAKSVLMTVVVPLTVGIVLRRRVPALAEKLARPVALWGMVLLVLSALPLVYAFWPGVSALFGNGTVLIIAAMATIGLGVGHVLGGPHAHTRTVLALSTTSRHPAIALAVAVAGGAETKPALAAILLYVIVATLISVPYVAWRKAAGAD
ncbi:bile acid:sodium symporter family protein [Rivibacter subsaxonicus]|uniref:BASS family bile acid:Na+ symporter n=1 Tax=Rivibacter subsaxonicus TaxID=457575 RepID=A0A4Q7VG56_9BURK|nr:bile acid:sodium symporter [Rivibacter subsaxonicus]RZT94974.1 BASS family bile acid:Na+ symporter [Rivibacter subsaxonicus]